MADIAFLMIVFFLVTSSFSQDKGLGLTLPEYGAQTRIPSRNITKVLVNAAGEIMHDGQIVTLEMLRQRVERMTADNPDLIVSITADPEALYETFVNVIDTVKEAGNEKISIAETIY
jgi:biopolymer transport protein ExbD